MQVGRTSDSMTVPTYSLISRTDKVELIATEFIQQSSDCLGYLEQHTKSCKSYLEGKYIYFRLKYDHFLCLKWPLKIIVQSFGHFFYSCFKSFML